MQDGEHLYKEDDVQIKKYRKVEETRRTRKTSDRYIPVQGIDPRNAPPQVPPKEEKSI